MRLEWVPWSTLYVLTPSTQLVHLGVEAGGVFPFFRGVLYRQEVAQPSGKTVAVGTVASDVKKLGMHDTCRSKAVHNISFTKQANYSHYIQMQNWSTFFSSLGTKKLQCLVKRVARGQNANIVVCK